MIHLALSLTLMTADSPCWMETSGGQFIDLSALCGSSSITAPPLPQSGVADANFASALMGLIGNMPPAVTVELLGLRDLPGIGRAYCDAVAQGASDVDIAFAFAEAYDLTTTAAANLVIALEVAASQYLC